VYFCIKKRKKDGFLVRYESVRDFAKADEKIDFLRVESIQNRRFENLKPDKDGNWIPIPKNDFHTFMPLANEQTKSARRPSQYNALFQKFTLGVSTNRDPWLYADNKDALTKKVKFLIENYEKHDPASEEYTPIIKWSETLKRRALSSQREGFNSHRIVQASYRPYVRRYLYRSELFIDRPGAINEMFPGVIQNMAICFSDPGSRTGYVVLAVDHVADLHFGASNDGYQQVPRYRIVKESVSTTLPIGR
jgi:predicted helicase